MASGRRSDVYSIDFDTTASVASARQFVESTDSMVTAGEHLTQTLRVTEQVQVQTGEAITREMRRAEAAYKRVMGAVDPLEAAQNRYEGQIRQLDRALKAGVVSLEQYDAALVKVTDAFKRSARQADETYQAERRLERAREESRREVEQLQASLDPLIAAQQQERRQLDLLRRAHERGAISLREYHEWQGRVRRSSAETQSMVGGSLPTWNKVAGIGSLIVSSWAASRVLDLLRDVGHQVVDVGSRFEQLQGQLGTAFQSSEKGRQTFEAVLAFASKTPFEVDKLTEAVITLQNRGISPLSSNLAAYGDIAAAFGADITDVVDAVAAATTGEMEQLKKFGIVAKQEGDQVQFIFRGTKTVVKKEAGEIAGYIESIGQANFAGAMEDQARTFEGRMSSLSDAWSQFLATVFEYGAKDALIPLIEAMTSGLTRGERNLLHFLVSYNVWTANLAEGAQRGADAIVEPFIIATSVLGDLIGHLPGQSAIGEAIEASSGIYRERLEQMRMGTERLRREASENILELGDRIASLGEPVDFVDQKLDQLGESDGVSQQAGKVEGLRDQLRLAVLDEEARAASLRGTAEQAVFLEQQLDILKAAMKVDPSITPELASIGRAYAVLGEATDEHGKSLLDLIERQRDLSKSNAELEAENARRAAWEAAAEERARALAEAEAELVLVQARGVEGLEAAAEERKVLAQLLAAGADLTSEASKALLAEARAHDQATQKVRQRTALDAERQSIQEQLAAQQREIATSEGAIEAALDGGYRALEAYNREQALRQELQRRGIDLSSEEGQAILANARRLEELAAAAESAARRSVVGAVADGLDASIETWSDGLAEMVVEGELQLGELWGSVRDGWEDVLADMLSGWIEHLSRMLLEWLATKAQIEAAQVSVSLTGGGEGGGLGGSLLNRVGGQLWNQARDWLGLGGGAAAASGGVGLAGAPGGGASAALFYGQGGASVGGVGAGAAGGSAGSSSFWTSIVSNSGFLAAVGTAAALVWARDRAHKDRDERFDLRGVDVQVQSGQDQGFWSPSPAMRRANIDERELIAAIHEIFDSVEQAAQGTLEELPKISLRLRGDAEQWKVVVGGTIEETFSTFEEAISFGVTQSVKDAEFSGLTDNVEAVIRQGAEIPLEELLARLEAARGVDRDLGDTGAGFERFSAQLRQARAELDAEVESLIASGVARQDAIAWREQELELVEAELTQGAAQATASLLEQIGGYIHDQQLGLDLAQAKADLEIASMRLQLAQVQELGYLTEVQIARIGQAISQIEAGFADGSIRPGVSRPAPRPSGGGSSGSAQRERERERFREELASMERAAAMDFESSARILDAADQIAAGAQRMLELGMSEEERQRWVQLQQEQMLADLMAGAGLDPVSQRRRGMSDLEVRRDELDEFWDEQISNTYALAAALGVHADKLLGPILEERERQQKGQVEDVIAEQGLPLEQARASASSYGETISWLSQRLAAGEISAERYAEVVGQIREQQQLEIMGIAEGLLERMGATDKAAELRAKMDEVNFHVQRMQLSILMESFGAIERLSGDTLGGLRDTIDWINDPENWPDFDAPVGGGDGADGDTVIWTIPERDDNLLQWLEEQAEAEQRMADLLASWRDDDLSSLDRALERLRRDYEEMLALAEQYQLSTTELTTEYWAQVQQVTEEAWQPVRDALAELRASDPSQTGGQIFDARRAEYERLRALGAAGDVDSAQEAAQLAIELRDLAAERFGTSTAAYQAYLAGLEADLLAILPGGGGLGGDGSVLSPDGGSTWTGADGKLIAIGDEQSGYLRDIRDLLAGGAPLGGDGVAFGSLQRTEPAAGFAFRPVIVAVPELRPAFDAAPQREAQLDRAERRDLAEKQLEESRRQTTALSQLTASHRDLTRRLEALERSRVHGARG
ncbi:MAG: hypothetical protein AAGN46_01230 [Acidobacteriota bacterium]